MAVVVGAERTFAQTPQLDGGLAGGRSFQSGVHAYDWRMGIHAQFELRFACRDRDHAVAEIQLLAESGGHRQRRVELHAHPPDLAETGVFVPRVGFADIINEITGGFDPGIDADIAIANGHRTVGIHTRRIPDDVVFREFIGTGVGDDEGPEAQAECGGDIVNCVHSGI